MTPPLGTIFKDHNVEDVSEISVRQHRMSSMADIMDAEETVDWIERRSSAVTEWASRTKCQKGAEDSFFKKLKILFYRWNHFGFCSFVLGRHRPK